MQSYWTYYSILCAGDARYFGFFFFVGWYPVHFTWIGWQFSGTGYWFPSGNMFYDLSVTVYFLAHCFKIRFCHYSSYGTHDLSVKNIWIANIWRKLIVSINDPSWTSCRWYLHWLFKVCLSGQLIFCPCATERTRVFFDDNLSSTRWNGETRYTYISFMLSNLLHAITQ